MTTKRAPLLLNWHKFKIGSFRSEASPSNYRHAIPRSRSLMSTLRCRCLFPVVGRQRHSPNVSRLIKFDPAVQRVLRIDINYPGPGSLVRQVDVHRDSHPRPQPDCRSDQCSMDVDDDSLSVAGPTPRIILKRDNHLQRDTSTASGIPKCRLRGHG